MSLFKTARRVVSASLAGGVVVLPLLLSGGASAAGEQGGRLRLTVSGAQNTWIRGVELNCPGAGGYHPHAAEACDALALADGEPGAVAGSNRLCLGKFDPVTATAEGEWDGRPVAWHRTYPSACALDAATGAVFRF
jgi:hypothetical protein